VLCLPPQVGKLERQGDHGAGREPAVPYHPAAAAERRADDHRDGEETHAVVVGHPQARDQAPASHQRQSPVRPILTTTGGRPAHASSAYGVVFAR